MNLHERVALDDGRALEVVLEGDVGRFVLSDGRIEVRVVLSAHDILGIHDAFDRILEALR